MYELFKESSSDKPGADPEAFSSMLESRRMVKCVCVVCVLISHYDQLVYPKK